MKIIITHKKGCDLKSYTLKINKYFFRISDMLTTNIVGTLYIYFSLSIPLNDLFHYNILDFLNISVFSRTSVFCARLVAQAVAQQNCEIFFSKKKFKYIALK